MKNVSDTRHRVIKNKETYMNVVMLTGPSSCGKTTVLNKEYDALIRSGAQMLTKEQLGEDTKDFKAVLSYKEKKIALFSMGDYSRKVVAAMREYAKTAEILVIACNDKFKKPFVAIEEYTHHIIWKRKQPLLHREDDDKKVMSDIMQKIMTWLG
jgi:nucleoside-triphosphatase THEP1